MAKYQFTSVLDTFEDAHKTLAKGTDEAARKEHDRKVYAAIMPPLAEVKAFYTGYEKFLNEGQAQAKSNMDAIEATIKKTKGKPSPAELKLLEQSQALIQKVVDALERDGAVLKNEMMDWRGVWDKTCAAVVFDQKMLLSIMAYRKSLIDTQAKTWNQQKERIAQYLTRADTLMVAVRKAAKDTPKSSAGEDLATLTKSHADCMNAGVKSIGSYISTIDSELVRWKDDAKKGLSDREKPNAAKLWAAKEPKIQQFETYRKGLSGASKTLDMLLKAVATGAKSADKSAASQWSDLKKKIEVDQKAIAVAEKQLVELGKYTDKVAANYKAAIKG